MGTNIHFMDIFSPLKFIPSKLQVEDWVGGREGWGGGRGGGLGMEDWVGGRGVEDWVGGPGGLGGWAGRIGWVGGRI